DINDVVERARDVGVESVSSPISTVKPLILCFDCAIVTPIFSNLCWDFIRVISKRTIFMNWISFSVVSMKDLLRPLEKLVQMYTGILPLWKSRKKHLIYNVDGQ